MMAREEGVKKKSEYFLHTPGTQAQKTFFYPRLMGPSKCTHSASHSLPSE